MHARLRAVEKGEGYTWVGSAAPAGENFMGWHGPLPYDVMHFIDVVLCVRKMKRFADIRHTPGRAQAAAWKVRS